MIKAAVELCPLCQHPSAIDHRPFCSRRCAELDLSRWLNGVYRVKTDEKPDDGEPEND